MNQTVISESNYDSLKLLGLINNSQAYKILHNSPVAYKSAGYLPPDGSFTMAIPPSDDGSSNKISLPFDFCFYGEPKNEVYINNNGNISFDGVFTSGTPFNFPFAGFKVIAPFWCDVDTRTRGGVYYKVLPNALVVNWEDVGSFDKNDSRGNSFQLIISDGTSELLPFGYTVGFFYNKLEWTAGSASGGQGGFGGAPAICGINAGDGVKYSLAGKYDKNDTTFVHQVDSLNGVAKLINQNTYFNPCDSNNQVPGLMGNKLRDTIGVCLGDTLFETYRFLAPESDQTTYTLVSSSSFPGFSLENTTTGNMATATIRIIGTTANMGLHRMTFKVVDSGAPNQLLEFDVIVQVDSLPMPLRILGDTVICSYDSTTLTVANVYDDYLWSTPSVDPAVTVKPGSYDLTVSYNNCESTKTHVVTGYLPSAQIEAPKFICKPDTVLLKAIPNLDRYQWSTGDSSSQISQVSGGVYHLTVTDMGCVNNDSVRIEDSLFVRITTSNINSCNGDSVILSVPNDYDQILWRNGSTSTLTRVGSGVHYVFVTLSSGSGNNCYASDTIQINNAWITPVSLQGDSFICGTGNTKMEVVDHYSAYLWDDGGTLKFNNINTSGIHSVTVTEGTCMDSVSFNVAGRPLPDVFIQGNLFWCDDADSAKLFAYGGTWDSLYWNTGDLTDTIYTGFGWKKVTAWKDGCSNFAWHPVNELIDGVDVQGITEICPGQATRLQVEFGFDFYQWNTGDIGFSTLVTAPGDYWCTVSLDTCSANTDIITVTMNTPDTVEIFGDTVMCDTAGGILFVDPSYTQFNWSTGEITPSIQYNNTGIYSVTVQDLGYCVTSDTVDVIQHTPKPVFITGDTHYCFSDSSLLDAGIYSSYLWSNGATVSPLKVRAGVYSVTVVDSIGCKSFDRNYRVTSSSPYANIYMVDTVCLKEEAIIYTDANSEVLWSTNELSDSIRVVPQEITLITQDNYGCQDDSTVIIPHLPTPNVGVFINPEGVSEAYLPVDFMDDSEDNGAPITSWFWEIGGSIWSFSQDTTIVFYEGGDISVTHTVSNDYGCSDTITVMYKISDDIVKVNVITPNGDGINDYLEFPNLQKFPDNRLTIYNRWGVEIASFENYRNFWDGFGIPDGTYFYILELNDVEEPVKGSFTVFTE